MIELPDILKVIDVMHTGLGQLIGMDNTTPVKRI